MTFLYLKNEVNAAAKSNKQKTFYQNATDPQHWWYGMVWLPLVGMVVCTDIYYIVHTGGKEEGFGTDI